MAFHGFDRDTFLLLAENKFNDSRPFYETVKEQIKQKAIMPMREICAELSDQLFELDEQMNLVPVKMVSRVRRDTRRAKNKDMYRDNVWAMFMRHKYEWHYPPCMWFEIMPGGYSIGVGMFYYDTNYLEHYRAAITESLQRHVYHPGHSAEAEGKYIISAIQRKIRERKESQTT